MSSVPLTLLDRWQDVDVEALPLDADGSRHSTVHRGAARLWADASHSRGGRSEHGIFGRADGSAGAGSTAQAKKADGSEREPGWPS